MDSDYKKAWIEYNAQLKQLESRGEGSSKVSQQVRNRMIKCWNKLSPKEQKEIAIANS